MSAPIQLIRLRKRRTRHQGLRVAARLGMATLCIAVLGMVFAWVYLHLPR